MDTSESHHVFATGRELSPRRRAVLQHVNDTAPATIANTAAALAITQQLAGAALNPDQEIERGEYEITDNGRRELGRS